MTLAEKRRSEYQTAMPRRSRYNAPPRTARVTLKTLLVDAGRAALEGKQLDFLRSPTDPGGRDDVPVFIAGERSILNNPCVSIVGTREVSEAGWRRASRLARELAMNSVVVVSGLARGVDTAALTGAIEAGGKTVGVIGTPLNKAYPAENAELHETIWRSHLLISPFAEGEPTFRGNFPKRNRVMAAVSDATVIIEASDTSGTLHQAAECQKLGRWLFIARSLLDDVSLAWPRKFLDADKSGKCVALESVDDILSRLPRR